MLTIAGRAKRVSQISEKVATGILSGVVKVTGYFTSSLANSKAGKKFFNMLPGEIVLASLDGFGTLLLLTLVSYKAKCPCGITRLSFHSSGIVRYNIN